MDKNRENEGIWLLCNQANRKKITYATEYEEAKKLILYLFGQR